METRLRERITKYKNMQKRVVEFFKKLEKPAIEIAGVNSILITKSIDLQLFTSILYTVLGSVAMLTSLN